MRESWLGNTPYITALEFMKNSQHEEILGLEHPAVVTLGRRGDPKQDLTSRFSPQDFELFQVERGGQATLHSPGQLVIYPLLSLRKYGLGVRQYVTHLERATMETLLDYGIQSHKRCDEPGLYTESGKLAFFGVRIQEGRTQHGLAINVSNDLSLFSAINSCGRRRECFDSMEKYGVTDSPERIFSVWCKNFNEGLKLTSSQAKSSLSTDMRV